MALDFTWGKFLLEIVTGIFGNQSIISMFIQNNLVLSGVLFFLLPLAILGLIILFFDFIVDSWKIPFAMVVDILKYLGFANPSYVYASIVAGPLVFYFLLRKKNKTLAIGLSLISALFSALLLIFPPGAIRSIAALIPLNTFLMLIATVLD